MPKQTFGLGRGLGSLIPARHASQGDAGGPKRGAKSDTALEPPTTPPYQVRGRLYPLPSAASGQALGKEGISATAFGSRPIDEALARSAVLEVPISEISSNHHQPRQYFDDASLQELAASIAAHGILQPLVVVKNDSGDGFELIAGERRLRAARMASQKTVPVIVRQADELERLELALIENIQRADLNPIEQAQAYKKLNDEFGLTQDQIAERMGKSRPVVTNTIRLLALPDEIRQAVAQGKIREGHAKALLEVKDAAKRLSLFHEILREKFSIPDTRAEATRIQVKPYTRRIRKDPNTIALEDSLRRALGTKVHVRRLGKNAGEIVIEYYGEEELQALVEKLTGGV